jgi:SAM-dependent methyltransferase
MTQIELYRAEALPVLQNTTFATREEARQSVTGDVRLVEDQGTGLVHNAAFDSDLLKYDENYQNEQSCSGRFQQHLGDVSSIIGRHFRDRRLIEIGCGKGYFLEQLRDDGFDVTGIDPAYEGVSPHVVKALFEPGLGLVGDAIVLRHVLEHIQDPVAFLSEIARSNGGRGLIYIEVPCLDWICRQRAWFDIFYEHVNYFRLTDFDRIFGTVVESGRVFGGQYLYVVADLASVRVPKIEQGDRVQFPADFVRGRDQFRALPPGKKAVWGAASKGVIFSIHMGQLGVELDSAIDINPVKQGRFLPTSGLRVTSPEDAMQRLPDSSTVFVMNSNYLDEIVAMSGNRYTYIAVEHSAASAP